MSRLEGKTWKESFRELRQKFLPTFTVSTFCHDNTHAVLQPECLGNSELFTGASVIILRLGVDLKAWSFCHTQLELIVWPPIQFINFYFLPLPLRLLFINATCLVWAIVLSTLKHNVSSTFFNIVSLIIYNDFVQFRTIILCCGKNSGTHSYNSQVNYFFSC